MRLIMDRISYKRLLEITEHLRRARITVHGSGLFGEDAIVFMEDHQIVLARAVLSRLGVKAAEAN